MRFLTGFVLLYAVMAGLAELDTIGGYGLVILAAVLVTAVVVDGPGSLATLSRPTTRALATASAIGLGVIAVYPVVSWTTGTDFTLEPGWPLLLVSVFAFNGIAEELVWRGYAFRRLRQGRSFTRAVLATMPLIAATHIPIIASSGLTVGVAAMFVAAITSLPFAHLYELGRNTIWAPALVHTAIDSFKIVDVPDASRLTFSLALSLVSCTVPLLALAVRRDSTTTIEEIDHDRAARRRTSDHDATDSVHRTT